MQRGDGIHCSRGARWQPGGSQDRGKAEQKSAAPDPGRNDDLLHTEQDVERRDCFRNRSDELAGEQISAGHPDCDTDRSEDGGLAEEEPTYFTARYA